MISLSLISQKGASKWNNKNLTSIVATWGTSRHWYSAWGRSHWIEHTEPRFSNFSVLLFMSTLSFCITNSILHHAVICQASCVATKGSNWILQLEVSCHLFWMLSVYLWLPTRVGLVPVVHGNGATWIILLTLEPSKFNLQLTSVTLPWESLSA